MVSPAAILEQRRVLNQPVSIAVSDLQVVDIFQVSAWNEVDQIAVLGDNIVSGRSTWVAIVIVTL